MKRGYFFELSEFLTENLPHFDFVLLFISQPEGKKNRPRALAYQLFTVGRAGFTIIYARCAIAGLAA